MAGTRCGHTHEKQKREGKWKGPHETRGERGKEGGKEVGTEAWRSAPSGRAGAAAAASPTRSAPRAPPRALPSPRTRAALIVQGERAEGGHRCPGRLDGIARCCCQARNERRCRRRLLARNADPALAQTRGRPAWLRGEAPDHPPPASFPLARSRSLSRLRPGVIELSWKVEAWCGRRRRRRRASATACLFLPPAGSSRVPATPPVTSRPLPASRFQFIINPL